MYGLRSNSVEIGHPLKTSNRLQSLDLSYEMISLESGFKAQN